MPRKTLNESFLKAAEARAKLKDREEKARDATRRTRFRWIVWVFATILLIALIVDLRHISDRAETFQRTGKVARKGDSDDLAAGMDGPRYSDPDGLFSLVPPRNWVRMDNPGSFYQAVFKGPYGMDMSIQTIATNGYTFNKLIEDLRRVERDLAATTHMDFTYVGPYRAVTRSAQIFTTKLLMIDFLSGDLAHHIQFSMPPELFDEYEPVFLRLIQTYQPGHILTAP